MVTAMSHQVTAALTGVLILSAAIWVGGFVAIAVVTRAARRTLAPDVQVRFFRAVGRSFGRVSSVALIVALAIGAILLSDRSWSGLLITAVVLTALLVLTTACGAAQARRMGDARQQALSAPHRPELVERVRCGARNAGALRGVDRRTQPRSSRCRRRTGFVMNRYELKGDQS